MRVIIAASDRCHSRRTVDGRRVGVSRSTSSSSRARSTFFLSRLRPFFEANRAFIVERAIDPDLWRNAGFTEEPPNHFLDLDAYGPYPFKDLPRSYDDAIKKHGVDKLKRERIGSVADPRDRGPSDSRLRSAAQERAIRAEAISASSRRSSATTSPMRMCRCTLCSTTTVS